MHWAHGKFRSHNQLHKAHRLSEILMIRIHSCFATATRATLQLGFICTSSWALSRVVSQLDKKSLRRDFNVYGSTDRLFRWIMKWLLTTLYIYIHFHIYLVYSSRPWKCQSCLVKTAPYIGQEWGRSYCSEHRSVVSAVRWRQFFSVWGLHVMLSALSLPGSATVITNKIVLRAKLFPLLYSGPVYEEKSIFLDISKQYKAQSWQTLYNMYNTLLLTQQMQHLQFSWCLEWCLQCVSGEKPVL